LNGVSVCDNRKSAKLVVAEEVGVTLSWNLSESGRLEELLSLAQGLGRVDVIPLHVQFGESLVFRLIAQAAHPPTRTISPQN